ncbi:PREDICTED: rhomboid-like protein 16, chloroplastic [Brassica oleracea var. oleracea]|uniref:rhomboid-like protein 16, chloroplastic n=1 Tax=Brassica oleracea var. oleracea TaxID=109376 RepID=UPI0006A6ED24|nr:PREDICTED: rhomboid-like protein 16, chloroplastic [Brassica oleracea var. oleracea]
MVFMAILKSYGVSFKDQSKLNLLFLGAEGPVYAITLLDIFLYPKVTTYFAFIFRVPVMIGIVGLGQDLLKVLEDSHLRIPVADALSLDQLLGNCRGRRVSPWLRLTWEEELWLQPLHGGRLGKVDSATDWFHYWSMNWSMKDFL